MILRQGSLAAALPLLAAPCCWAQQYSFTVAGGQIFTPGLAILDSPQPGTPLGGDNLHIALDVSANGRLNLPPYVEESPTLFHSISIFLYSYSTGMNFTVANVSASDSSMTRGILAQEPESTVKHVNWRWPDCLVGNGQPRTLDDVRGAYNISIRQHFRLNNENYYTIFDMPISVTNSISEMAGGRPSCDTLRNNMMAPDLVSAQAVNGINVLFAPGDNTEVDVILPDDGIGGTRPVAGPGNGLGSEASTLSWSGGWNIVCFGSMALALVL